MYKRQEYISIKADYKTTLVRISDIVYLESEGEYVRLHLDDLSLIHISDSPGKIRTEKRESTIAVPVSPVFLKITVPESHPLPGKA